MWKDKKRRPLVFTFTKVFLKQFIMSYPFIALVRGLSNIDSSKFVPCDGGCISMKLLGDDFLATTISASSSPFVNVTHGIIREGRNALSAEAYLSDRCPRLSSEQRHATCSSHETKKRIKARYLHGIAERIYVWATCGWLASKVFHDCMLLYGFDEFTTLRIGLVTLFFQMTMTAAAFCWATGAAEVAGAPLAVGGKEFGSSCFCIYQLPELETLITFATPAVLFNFVSNRFSNSLRATLCGDYVYCTVLYVPFHVVAKSAHDPLYSYLVSSTHGRQRLEPEERPLLQFGQTQKLLTYFKWARGYFRGMCAIISVSLMPMVGRIMQMQSGCTSYVYVLVPCSLIGLAGFTTYLLFYDTLNMVRCQLRAGYTQHTCGHRFLWMASRVGQATMLISATVVLAMPFIADFIGRTQTLSTTSVAWWALAGSLYFCFGIFNVFRLLYIQDCYLALEIKAHDPSLTPGRIRTLLKECQEFGLEDEEKLADEYIGYTVEDEWKERWCNGAKSLSSYALIAVEQECQSCETCMTSGAGNATPRVDGSLGIVKMPGGRVLL